MTAPRVRLAPLLPRQQYPGPRARASNQLHEVDLVGPIDLEGSGHRNSIWVGKDAFDGAVCLRLASSRRMAARTLSRVIRLCLRFGVSPVFIPKGEPQFNGGVENLHGWFQEPLLQRKCHRPGSPTTLT